MNLIWYNAVLPQSTACDGSVVEPGIRVGKRGRKVSGARPVSHHLGGGGGDVENEQIDRRGVGWSGSVIESSLFLSRPAGSPERL